MATQNLATAPVLRPARLNAAGRCLHCLGVGCDSARCIEMHAQAVWELCTRCGGTEYVNGHRDPVTASTRCDCVGGLTEATPAGRSGSVSVAEVVPMRPLPSVQSNRRVRVVETGAPRPSGRFPGLGL